MSVRILSRASAPAVVALVLAATLAPADASTPGWRIVETFGQPSGTALYQSVVATGANDAWSAGFFCSPRQPSCTREMLVEHWNGSAWHRTTVPAVLAQPPAGFLGPAIAASSASNAWAFGETAAPTPEEGAPEAAHWDGTKWTASALPAWAYNLSADGCIYLEPEVFSRHNAWLFNLNMSGSTFYADHYDGTAWSERPLPGNPVAVSALGATDIWAVVITPKTAGLPLSEQKHVAIHWDGHSWKRTSLPDLHLASGEYLLPVAMTALGASQIWLQALIEEPGGQFTDILLGWNGTSWTRADTPLQNDAISPAGLAQDGNGGVWLPLFGPAPKYAPYLYHYSAGQWTSQAEPTAAGSHTQVNGLAWIPGTTSLWAAAQSIYVKSNGTVAAILKYGP
jgi:hypothetical protein